MYTEAFELQVLYAYLIGNTVHRYKNLAKTVQSSTSKAEWDIVHIILLMVSPERLFDPK